jgi:hypothetical protein
MREQLPDCFVPLAIRRAGSAASSLSLTHTVVSGIAME